MSLQCAPCLSDLALVRDAVTSIGGTATCTAHAVLMRYPSDDPGRRRRRLSDLRTLAESRVVDATGTEKERLELLVQEYAVAEAMDLGAPDRTGPGRTERTRRGKERPPREGREGREGRPPRESRHDRGRHLDDASAAAPSAEATAAESSVPAAGHQSSDSSPVESAPASPPSSGDAAPSPVESAPASSAPSEEAAPSTPPPSDPGSSQEAPAVPARDDSAFGSPELP